MNKNAIKKFAIEASVNREDNWYPRLNPVDLKQL